MLTAQTRNLYNIIVHFKCDPCNWKLKAPFVMEMKSLLILNVSTFLACNRFPTHKFCRIFIYCRRGYHCYFNTVAYAMFFSSSSLVFAVGFWLLLLPFYFQYIFNAHLILNRTKKTSAIIIGIMGEIKRKRGIMGEIQIGPLL